MKTGTFLGATTAEMRKHFQQLYTIELSHELYSRANAMFSKYANVKTLHGDSGKVLFDVVKKINATVLFWLDGHYSGGISTRGDIACPIFKEPEAVFQLENIEYVIMIDDARCFSNPFETNYPSIEILEKYVNENSPLKMSLDVSLDIISFKPIK